MVRKGLFEKVSTFEVRLDGYQEARGVKIWGQELRVKS